MSEWSQWPGLGQKAQLLIKKTAISREVAQERGLKLGQITDAFDARIQRIVDNWPVSVDGARAVALGLPSPPPLKTIVEQYLEGFGKR